MTLGELFKPKKYFMCIATDMSGNEYWINRPSGKIFRTLKDYSVIKYDVDLNGNLYCLIKKAREEE